MQVGNCFVPRRGSGDNARYARVSCEETLETCERIRGAMLRMERSAVGLLSLPRCRALSGGTEPALRDPRAPTRLIRHLDNIVTSMTPHTHTQRVSILTSECHLLVLTLFSHNYSRNYSGIRSGSPTLTHHSINRHRTPLSRVGPSPGDHLVSVLPSGCGFVICIISDVSTHASRTRMSHGINRWDSSLHK